MPRVYIEGKLRRDQSDARDGDRHPACLALPTRADHLDAMERVMYAHPEWSHARVYQRGLIEMFFNDQARKQNV